MVLGKGNFKLHTEDLCLCPATKENCFDLRNSNTEDCMANISSHTQQGVCCVLLVQYRDNLSVSSINKYLQIQMSLILDKGVAVLEVLI